MSTLFPLAGLSGPLEGIPSILPTGNTWQGSGIPVPGSGAPTSTNPGPIGGTAGKVIGSVGDAIGKAYGAGGSFLGMLFGSDYQYLTGIIGLILIVAGFFLFRPVRETVIKAGRAAAVAA